MQKVREESWSLRKRPNQNITCSTENTTDKNRIFKNRDLLGLKVLTGRCGCHMQHHGAMEEEAVKFILSMEAIAEALMSQLAVYTVIPISTRNPRRMQTAQHSWALVRVNTPTLDHTQKAGWRGVDSCWPSALTERVLCTGSML